MRVINHNWLIYNDNDNIKQSHVTASFNDYLDKLVALTRDFPLLSFS